MKKISPRFLQRHHYFKGKKRHINKLMASANRVKRKFAQLHIGKVTTHSENLAAAVIEAASTKKELVRFLYATFFCPTKST